MELINLQFDGTFWANFWANFFGTVLGGIFLATILFVLSERVFSPPAISGSWECQETTQDSAHPPYAGMIVWYKITLIQNGFQIIGSGEKDREEAASGSRNYKGSDRVSIQISGSIEKFYTKPDLIRIHWIENGEIRQSSTIHQLQISGNKVKGDLVGIFHKTAGTTSGRSYWKRST
jgi:hypothetical protein